MPTPRPDQTRRFQTCAPLTHRATRTPQVCARQRSCVRAHDFAALAAAAGLPPARNRHEPHRGECVGLHRLSRAAAPDSQPRYLSPRTARAARHAQVQVRRQSGVPSRAACQQRNGGARHRSWTPDSFRTTTRQCGRAALPRDRAPPQCHRPLRRCAWPRAADLAPQYRHEKAPHHGVRP